MGEGPDPPTTTITDDRVCPICHGAGFVRVRVPVGHPLFGKALPCRCKQQEFSDRRLADLRRASNLGQLQEMTFDSYRVPEGARPELAYALRDARAISERFAADPKGWIIFTGPYGCGKTHLAASIANACLKRGVPLLFVVVPDLLDYLRAAYAPDSPVSYDERFEQVRNVELLILDDLGTQNTTPWAAEKLYQILNHRYNAQLPTIITSNLHLTEMDPRLASRLRDQDRVTIVPLYGADFRTSGKDDAFGSLRDYGDMNFETFSDRGDDLDPAQRTGFRRAVASVRDYAESPVNWLVIRGDYGVGKTHLAAAVANKVVQGGTRVLFVVVADLLDHLRATYQPGSSVSYDRRFNEVRRAWLLVLDDLGMQNATPWAQEKLFQILNFRYVGALATVITTSSAGWEHLDERLKSRLMDASRCVIVDLDVPSYRGKTPPQKVRRTTRRRL